MAISMTAQSTAGMSPSSLAACLARARRGNVFRSGSRKCRGLLTGSYSPKGAVRGLHALF